MRTPSRSAGADPVGPQGDPSPAVEVNPGRRRVGVDAGLDRAQLGGDVERPGRDRRLAGGRRYQEAEVLRRLGRLGQHVEIGGQHEDGDALRPAGRRATALLAFLRANVWSTPERSPALSGAVTTRILETATNAPSPAGRTA
jgi:hypothetical protein